MVPGRISVILSFLLISLLCLAPTLSWSQGTTKIDSLWLEYAQTTDDSTRLTRLAEIASQYLRTPQRDTALVLAQQALDTARELNLANVQATAHFSLGEAYDVLGQLEPALEQFATGLAIALRQNNKKALTRGYNLRGLAYHFAGQYEDALADYQESLALARQQNDGRKEAAILQNMGRSYTQTSDYYEALSSYLDARNIKDSLYQQRDSTLTMRERISAHLNLGALYQQLHQYELAKTSYQTALDLTPKTDAEARAVLIFNLGSIQEAQQNYAAAAKLYLKSLQLVNDNQINRRKAAIVLSLGNVYLEQDQRELAGDYYQQAAILLEQIPNPIFMIDLQVGRSEWYLKGEDFTAAITDAEEALRVARARNYPDGQSKAHNLLARVAEATENWPMAATHLRAYVEWQDSLQSADRKLELVGLQAVKDVELAEAQHQIELAQQEAALTRSWNRILLGALAIICILTILIAIARSRLAVSNRKLNTANSELNESNLNLHSSNQQLNLANNKLQQFAFATGHDLKESLRSITSFTQLAQIELLKDGTSAQQHLKEASAGGKRMRKMLDDLLTVANLSVTDSVEANIPIREVIGSVKVQLEEDIIESQGDVRLVTPATLKANRNAVEQLFFNLVHNAVKYAGPDNAPRITIEAEKRGEDVVFMVKDNGPGIAVEERETIFESFHRLHDRHKSGSGLGLAICKRIVEEHGGKIWYEPRQDGKNGSVFSFTLPQAQPKVMQGVLG